MRKNHQSGMILPSVLSAILAFIIISGAVFTLIQSNLQIVSRNIKSQQAFNISEAGINYYLWHLSHAPTDYKDGQTTPATPDPNLGYGPYVHSYTDDNSKTVGTYTLWIKPDNAGSTMSTVRSIGKVNGTNITRTIEAKIGASSFANFALASDQPFWVGQYESVDGPVHSNVGIRMDGASNSIVSSSNATYVPPTNLGGDGSSHPGVWCHSSITAPINCNTRPKTDWIFPTPLVDFNVVTDTLCTIKKVSFAADSSTANLATQPSPCSQTPKTQTPFYLPQRSNSGAFSVDRGYLIELNSNGTYNMYAVDQEKDTKANYNSALRTTLLYSNLAPPSNGILFVEDNVWVRTNSVYSGRITIAAGRLATNTMANIKIIDNIKYSTKNGADAIGLIAEDSVELTPYALPQTGDFNFEVDASIIAKEGNVGYPDKYHSNSSKCTMGWVGDNQKFLFYGSIASRTTWTWTWDWGNRSCPQAVRDSSSGSYISGVKNNTTKYDYNLLYGPPPYFPLVGGHSILSWREVLTKP